MPTTLQLARLVANAARASDDEGAALAVLDELRKNSAWFCRCVQTVDDVDVDVPYERVVRRRVAREPGAALPFSEFVDDDQ